MQFKSLNELNDSKRLKVSGKINNGRREIETLVKIVFRSTVKS